jgi:hypothetical protein
MAPVSVKSFASRAEAELAGTLLRSEGIEFFIAADDAGGTWGRPMLFRMGVRLMVDDGDAERAAELLAEPA